MKIFIYLSLLCLLLCIIVTPVISGSSLPRRRETLALFRGFLCYLKGESLQDCRDDEDVTNVINSIAGDTRESIDDERPATLSKEPSVLRSAFPLPPHGSRKRDAFYSDWKRK